MKNGFSKMDWHDAYYDGYLIDGSIGFDEDSQSFYTVYDYWNFKITDREKGYIEDASDEWYLDMKNGKIPRIK